MSTLLGELTALKTAEDKITGNKVANFAYDDYAYENDDANGVDTYNVNNHQNIPNGTASILKVNATVLTKGWRAQASAITRMLIDHFLGRCSYNLNKVNDHFSTLLTKLMDYLGEPNGIATLDRDGDIFATQVSLEKIGLDNVVNTGDSNVPVENGTTKFTSGGAYAFFGGQVTVGAWLGKVFSWVLGKVWQKSTITAVMTGVYYANNIWVAIGDYSSYWSEDGKVWTPISDLANKSLSCVYYDSGVWVAGGSSGAYWSEDGKNWIQCTGITSLYFMYAVNGFWVGAGVNNGIWWSENGKAWTQGTGSYTSPTVNGSVYYANGIWVAGSGNKGTWWSTNGKAWTQGTGISSSATAKAYYANGLWVAGTSNAMWWSTDGKAWTQGTGITSGSYYQSVYYARGLWVVAGASSAWSEDGKVWTQGTGASFSAILTLSYANNIWLAGDRYNGVFWSENGKSWNGASGFGSATVPRAVYYANGTWVCVLEDSGIFYSDYSIALGD